MVFKIPTLFTIFGVLVLIAVWSAGLYIEALIYKPPYYINNTGTYSHNANQKPFLIQ